MAQGDAAAQLVAVGVDAGADRRREAAKAVARIAVQHHLPVELLGGAREDGDRAPARGARALVEGMAAVAVQLVVASVGLEGPAEELLARGGVLGDEQDRADGGGAGEGAVDVGQPRRPAGGVVVRAVAAVAGAAGEGARQRAPKDRTAAGLGVALCRGALCEEPEVSRFHGMAQLPGVAPAVGGGIGVGANHAQRCGGIAREGVDGGSKGAEGLVELHADPCWVLAGPLPAAGSEGLAEHLRGQGAGAVVGVASLVRSSRPWPPIASHSLPSGALK